MKEATIYGRFGRLLNPNDPNLFRYTVEGDTVTLGIAHRPDFNEDMQVVFEKVLSFSDSHPDEPLIPVEIVIGFDEKIEASTPEAPITYYMVTDERELIIVTRTPPQIIDLKAEKIDS